MPTVHLRILCPSCEAYVTLDEGLQSANCPQCHRWLHAIECRNCRHSFVALGIRSQECPCCGKTVRIAPDRLRTFGDARDPDTEVVLVVGRRSPPPNVGLIPAPDARATPRFLAQFFSILTTVAIILGVAVTVLVDAHLATFPRAGWAVVVATCVGLGSTAISAAIFAFFSYALALLLELVERPAATLDAKRAEDAPAREARD